MADNSAVNDKPDQSNAYSMQKITLPNYALESQAIWFLMESAHLVYSPMQSVKKQQQQGGHLLSEMEYYSGLELYQSKHHHSSDEFVDEIQPRPGPGGGALMLTGGTKACRTFVDSNQTMKQFLGE